MKHVRHHTFVRLADFQHADGYSWERAVVVGMWAVHPATENNGRWILTYVPTGAGAEVRFRPASLVHLLRDLRAVPACPVSEKELRAYAHKKRTPSLAYRQWAQEVASRIRARGLNW